MVYTHGDGTMTNRTAEAMIDKWDGVLATMETGECETCSREFPVDAMTHHEESATSECHQCEAEYQRWANWYFAGKRPQGEEN